MPRNDGPVLRDDLVSGTEDQPLFVIPAEAFGNDYDLQGDVLFFHDATVLGVLDTRYLSSGYTVEAKAADNEPLPDWLTFDPETMRFSGTPPVGTTSIEVALFLHDPSNGATYAHHLTLSGGQIASGVSVSNDVLSGYI
ncbi:hypothetical protein LTR94_033518, partial [Friedmanniomyces endolithicus]